MSSATLTLIGLYQYDHDLFTNLKLPDGIDKGLTIDAIIMRGGEYEVIYPNPNLMRELIGSWSKQWGDVFYNWYRATEGMKEIRPLDNYDRHESWSDSGSNHSTSTDTMNGSGSTNGSDTSHGTGTVTNNTTDTSKISADDSNSFVNRTQDQSENTQGNVTDTNATTLTSSQTNTHSSAESSGTNSSTHEGHVYGNIGVTTSAHMFKEFYDIMRQYGNIYDSIATVFCQSFVIPIL